MNRRTLAKALRRRQQRMRLVPKQVVSALTDGDVLDAYLACARCGAALFQDTDGAIAGAASAEEFIAAATAALDTHVCHRHN